MAHWIIEDQGFGGQVYKCSECGDSWNDIYSDISRETECPNCGALIHEDETEYIENNNRLKRFDRNTSLSILKELSRDMYPSYDLFGKKTLVIDRDKFEAIRKKYLDVQL